MCSQDNLTTALSSVVQFWEKITRQHMKAVSLWLEEERRVDTRGMARICPALLFVQVSLYLFLHWSHFMRRVDNVVGEPGSQWGAQSASWKKATGGNSCLVVNVWTSLDHTRTHKHIHARYVLSVFYSATTDCCRETLYYKPSCTHLTELLFCLLSKQTLNALISLDF